MMFELIAAAVVAVFVSFLFPIARDFFRDLEETGPPPVRALNRGKPAMAPMPRGKGAKPYRVIR